MATIEECKQIWREADAVCFDVDSTVVKDEGLYELVEFCGFGQKVRHVRIKDGVSFHKPFHDKLDLVKPTQQQVIDFKKKHDILFSEGIIDLVSMLHERGTSVFLISGGLRSAVEPIAEKLGIPKQNIFANRIKFYHNGEYAGYDHRQPTSSSGRTKKVAEQLKKDYRKVAVVGDGVTDLHAYPPADCFIGYGGNRVHRTVKANAVWYITDFKDLVDELKSG